MGEIRRMCVRLSLPFLVKLVRVYEIMPDAIESADNGGDGIKEDQSHPDDENGILLAECLTCSYGRTLYWVNILTLVLAF